MNVGAYLVGKIRNKMSSSEFAHRVVKVVWFGDSIWVQVYIGQYKSILLTVYDISMSQGQETETFFFFFFFFFLHDGIDGFIPDHISDAGKTQIHVSISFVWYKMEFSDIVLPICTVHSNMKPTSKLDKKDRMASKTLLKRHIHAVWSHRFWWFTMFSKPNICKFQGTY